MQWSSRYSRWLWKWQTILSLHWTWTICWNAFRSPGTISIYKISNEKHNSMNLCSKFWRYLQNTFDMPLVIQLTDDEKFLWKDLEIHETHQLTKCRGYHCLWFLHSQNVHFFQPWLYEVKHFFQYNQPQL